MRAFTGLFRVYTRPSLRLFLLIGGVVLGLTLLLSASLPKDLFLSQNIPDVKLAVSFEAEDELASSLPFILKQVEAVESVEAVDQKTAQQQLDEGVVDACFVLEEDLLDSILSGKETTISVYARDPLKGMVVRSLADQSARTFNNLQGAMVSFSDEAKKTFGAKSEKYSEAVNAFSKELMTETLVRDTSVHTATNVSPYLAHFLSIALFVAVSFCAIAVTLMVSNQMSSGLMRRFYVRGVRFAHLYIVLLLITCIFSVVLGVAASIVLSLLGIEANGIILCLSFLVLALVVFPLYLMFGGIRGKDTGDSLVQTMLGCFLVAFLLLFLGGGFYPSYLTDSIFTQVNPVYLSTVFAEWSLGNEAINFATLLPFLGVIVLCGSVCYYQWKKSLQ